MGWISQLSATYDACQDLVGKYDEIDKSMLLPISHLTALAQAEIIVNYDGDFLRAEKVVKDKAMTMIPVTQDSASRSSGIAPMPLHDKLCYIAGDFDKECPEKKSSRPYFEAYMAQLESWSREEETPREVKAVYQYLKKETVVADLKREGIFDKKEDFIRFIVRDTDNDRVIKLWEEEAVWKNYCSYYSRQLEEKGICYVSGQREVVALKQPAKIRHAGDKAKLISSNDTSGFTYRGRFRRAQEATEIGYETSQKAHNALRWLLQKQGQRNGSESVVCWAVERYKTLNIFDDNFEEISVSSAYAKLVNQKMRGYYQELNPGTKINLIAVDTADGAGQGRLAINYYIEMDGEGFYQNLEKWYQECRWVHQYRKDETGKYPKVVGTPSPREIVLTAYGVERNDLLSADEKIQKKNIDRLIPCIVQKARFPKDMMRAAVQNASSPLRYSGYNWNRILTNTCALICKCKIDDGKGQGICSMELNKGENGRDYLFGRLLAIVDEMESRVLYKKEEKRETNAKRYFNTFSRKPAKTFELLKRRVHPYENDSRLSQREKRMFESLITEIMEKLKENDGYHNRPLKEEYLLGYYCQLADLRRKNEDKDSKKESEGEANE